MPWWIPRVIAWITMAERMLQASGPYIGFMPKAERCIENTPTLLAREHKKYMAKLRADAFDKKKQ